MRAQYVAPAFGFQKNFPYPDNDELAKMVGVSVPVLHVLVHRARVQFAEHGIPSAAAVIGVRRGGRRLGMERVEIVRH